MMLFIKEIDGITPNPYFSITFQGFNRRVYYRDMECRRTSSGFSAIKKVITYDGRRYGGHTQEAYLCDEYLVELQEKAYGFIRHLYSEHLMEFLDGKIRFTFTEKYSPRESCGYVVEEVEREEVFAVCPKHFALIRQRREEFLRLPVHGS